MTMAMLAGWENYYVIVGSSAGGLTGLTFVVIALAADARRVTPIGLRTFVTPAIVYFCTVLGLAAYLSMPAQTPLGLSIGFGVVGLGGVVYSCISGAGMGRMDLRYIPVIEDWLWHVIFPGLLYALMLTAGIVIWHHAAISLYMVAITLLLLMFVGIHNAWDVATSISMRKPDDGAAPADPPPPADS